MDLHRQPAITLTLHQLQRLVAGYIDLDDCRTLDGVAMRMLDQAVLHAEMGCEECKATVEALGRLTLVSGTAATP